VLKNPAYAGAYAFGRYTSRRTVDPDGTVHTTIVERPRPEWAVLIKDHHDGYITWADFLVNEAWPGRFRQASREVARFGWCA
jgi:Recombinase